MRLEGQVTRTTIYGAFVDLGLEHEGMIHISRLAPRRVNKVTDVVNPGDEVKVWVVNSDPESGRIGLTMVQPPEVEWDEIQEGEIYPGRVVRLERYGAFVDIGAERPGLLHVREMGKGYVRHPSEVVKEGEEIEVKVQKVNRRKRQIDLTLDLNATQMVEAGEEEEPFLSPMEIAFREAQKGGGGGKGRQRGGRSQRGDHRETLEEIYRRTLKGR
jgi:predicted RNA-binding protein with RPS1 domain